MREVFRERAIHGVQRLKILQIHLHVNNIFERKASGADNGLNVLDGLFGLRIGVSGNRSVLASCSLTGYI